MQELRGKTAVITGGGSGIGRGMATVFAREGMQIVVADVEEAAAAETVEMVTSAGGRAVAVLVTTKMTNVGMGWAQLKNVIGDIEPLVTLALIKKYYGVYTHSPAPIPAIYTEEPVQSGPRRVIVKRR